MGRRIWIAHHDVHAKALRYDVDTGSADAKARADAPRLARGFYVDIPGGVAGLYASPEGPTFFIDDKRIPVDDAVRVAVERGRRRNVFRLHRADALEVELSYAKPTDIGVGDAFSSEFDRDFFVWLTESHPDPSLQTYYTHPYPDGL